MIERANEIERMRAAAEEYEALRQTVVRIARALPKGVDVRPLLGVRREAKFGDVESGSDRRDSLARLAAWSPWRSLQDFTRSPDSDPMKNPLLIAALAYEKGNPATDFVPNNPLCVWNRAGYTDG